MKISDTFSGADVVRLRGDASPSLFDAPAPEQRMAEQDRK